MQELTNKTFSKVLRSDNLILVDFWAPWCPWCKRLTPILKKLENDYEGKIVLTMLNTENYPDIASKYGIMSLPNLVFFCGGRVVSGIVGYMPEEKLIQEFDKALSKYKDCYSQSSQIK